MPCSSFRQVVALHAAHARRKGAPLAALYSPVCMDPCQPPSSQALESRTSRAPQTGCGDAAACPEGPRCGSADARAGAVGLPRRHLHWQCACTAGFSVLRVCKQKAPVTWSTLALPPDTVTRPIVGEQTDIVTCLQVAAWPGACAAAQVAAAARLGLPAAQLRVQDSGPGHLSLLCCWRSRGCSVLAALPHLSSGSLALWVCMLALGKWHRCLLL